ncbi:MAG: hypothetical protein DRN20_05135, partial [Thermoplasmata archaeon]
VPEDASEGVYYFTDFLYYYNNDTKEGPFFIPVGGDSAIEVVSAAIEVDIYDKDGDGHWEAGELITVNWTAIGGKGNITVYRKSEQVEVTGNTSDTNGTFTFTAEEGTYRIIGNVTVSNETIEVYNKTFVAYANDYLIYIERTKPKTVFGLNVTKTAVIDVINASEVSVSVDGAQPVRLPMNKFERQINEAPVDKANVYVDDRANITLQPGEVANLLWLCNDKSSFDFTITAPGKEGMVTMFKIRDENTTEVIEDLLRDQTIDVTIDKAKRMADKVFIFGSGGFGVANITDGELKEFASYGEMPGLTTNLSENIDNFKVLLDEFSPNYAEYYSEFIESLTSGIYILSAITKDQDVVGTVAMAVIIITEGNEPDVKTVVNESEAVTVNYSDATKSWAFMLKDEPYNVTAEFYTSLKFLEVDSIKAELDELPLRPIYYDGSTKIWIPEGYGKGAVNRTGGSIAIDTSDLPVGDHKLFTLAVKYNKVQYAKVYDVEIKEVDNPPMIKLLKANNVTLINGMSNVTLINFIVVDDKAIEKMWLDVNGEMIIDGELPESGWNYTDYYDVEYGWVSETWDVVIPYLVSKEGNYTVNLTAQDTGGNKVSRNTTFTAEVDYVPTINVFDVSPANVTVEYNTTTNSYTTNSTTLNVNVTDESLDEIKIDAIYPNGTRVNLLTNTSPSSPYDTSITINITEVAGVYNLTPMPGTYILELSAKDTAGSCSYGLATFNLTIETIANVKVEAYKSKTVNITDNIQLNVTSGANTTTLNITVEIIPVVIPKAPTAAFGINITGEAVNADDDIMLLNITYDFVEPPEVLWMNKSNNEWENLTHPVVTVNETAKLITLNLTMLAGNLNMNLTWLIQDPMFAVAKKDTTRPSLTVLAPESTYSNLTVNFILIANESLSKATIKIWNNSYNITANMNKLNATAYIYQWTAPNVTVNTIYNYNVTAWDLANNSNFTTGTITVMPTGIPTVPPLDTTPPVIDSWEPTGTLELTLPATVTIKIVCHDNTGANVSGINTGSIKLIFDGKDVKPSITLTDGKCTVKYKATIKSEGAYSVKFYVEDNAGNGVWRNWSFMVKKKPPVGKPPVGGGVVVAPPPINVPVDPTTGVVTSTTTLTVDGATLIIPEGTIVKDAEGNPLSTSITMLYIPATAERIGAIAAYDFGPSGTTFSPPIDLVIAYDLADIPAGYAESDLVIRMWDGTAWIDLPTTVDTVVHTATAKVSHFTIFALFAAPKVVPTPTPPVVTPTPTIPPVTPTPTPTPPVVPPKIPWTLIIGIIIAVIVIGVVAYYFYT